MKTAKPIVLNKRDLQTLKSWANSATIEARIKERAKIILLAHEGKTNKEIAEYMHTREATIGKWRSRFIQSGLAGLDDLERTGFAFLLLSAHTGAFPRVAARKI